MVNKYEIITDLSNLNDSYSKAVENWYNENNDDMMFILWDKNDKIRYVSKLMNEFIRTEQLLKNEWTEIIPSPTSLQIIKHFKHEDNKLHIPHLTINNSKNKPIEFNAIIDKIKIDNAYFFICQLTNLTKLNELKNNLIDLEKLKMAGEFAAGLVHEFRNPLTSLKGFLQLLQAGIEQKEEYYRVMIEEIEKLELIASELLFMSKPLKQEKTYAFIDEMIHDVLFLLQSHTSMQNIDFQLNLEKDLKLFCNPTQIKQVLINIIKNGVEAMDMKGILKIHCYQNSDGRNIEIIDEGKGISEQELKQINNPFFTTKEEGTGLGLMITNHILSLHEAKLKVNADNIGETIFRIIFPLTDEV